MHRPLRLWPQNEFSKDSTPYGRIDDLEALVSMVNAIHMKSIDGSAFVTKVFVEGKQWRSCLVHVVNLRK